MSGAFQTEALISTALQRVVRDSGFSVRLRVNRVCHNSTLQIKIPGYKCCIVERLVDAGGRGQSRKDVQAFCILIFVALHRVINNIYNSLDTCINNNFSKATASC